MYRDLVGNRTGLVINRTLLLAVLLLTGCEKTCLEYRDVQTTCGGAMRCVYRDFESMICYSYSIDPTYACTVQQCVRRATGNLDK